MKAFRRQSLEVRREVISSVVVNKNLCLLLTNPKMDAEEGFYFPARHQNSETQVRQLYYLRVDAGKCLSLSSAQRHQGSHHHQSSSFFTCTSLASVETTRDIGSSVYSN